MLLDLGEAALGLALGFAITHSRRFGRATLNAPTPASGQERS
jgi:hypothetical protein